MEIAGSTPSELRAAKGHWRELPASRADVAYHRVETQLQLSVLAQPAVQDALIEIGRVPDPSLDDQKSCAARTTRARLIELVSSALRDAISFDEVSHYAQIIALRRSQGLWHNGCSPLGTPVGSARSSVRGNDDASARARRGPDRASIDVAARALAECVVAARAAVPEQLGKYERDTMNRVLTFVGLDGKEARRRYRSAEGSAAQRAEAHKKRTQRQKAALKHVVAAERARLTVEVATGRLTELADGIYAAVEDAPDERLLRSYFENLTQRGDSQIG